MRSFLVGIRTNEDSVVDLRRLLSRDIPWRNDDELSCYSSQISKRILMTSPERSLWLLDLHGDHPRHAATSSYIQSWWTSRKQLTVMLWRNEVGRKWGPRGLCQRLNGRRGRVYPDAHDAMVLQFGVADKALVWEFFCSIKRSDLSDDFSIWISLRWATRKK